MNHFFFLLPNLICRKKINKTTYNNKRIQWEKVYNNSIYELQY
jgi:hypothetical protein